MEKYYRVVFVYPDGHLEDIEDTFKSGADALECGNTIMAQISSTEQYRSKYSEDKKDPYFIEEAFKTFFEGCEAAPLLNSISDFVYFTTAI